MKELGDLIDSISLKSGLFGKKPTGIEIHENGIVIKYKTEDKKYLFEKISAMKSSDYFYPNPAMYNMDILGSNGEKIVSLAFPYMQRDDMTKLLVAHREALKGSDFPNRLMETSYVLCGGVTWEKGKLYQKRKEGIAEYTPEQIEDFILKDGMYFFTLKNSKKDIITILMHDSPNCLFAIDACYAIANIS